MLAGNAVQTQLYDSPTFMYSMEVGKYSLVSRSMGTNAVYLLRMLQALLVWIAYSWYLRPDPRRSDQHHQQHFTAMLLTKINQFFSITAREKIDYIYQYFST